MHTLVHVASRGKCSVFPNCFLPYFYLFFKHVLIVYVMGMHVPWHTRVKYGLEDNFQELVLSFQLVGPKDRTQATIHTYSFKKYLFMCVWEYVCVTMCGWRSEDNLSELVLLPWVPEISLRLSGLAAGTFNLLSHLDMSGSPNPMSVEDQTQVIMLTRKVQTEPSFPTLCFSLSWLADPQIYTSFTFKVNGSMIGFKVIILAPLYLWE